MLKSYLQFIYTKSASLLRPNSYIKLKMMDFIEFEIEPICKLYVLCWFRFEAELVRLREVGNGTQERPREGEGRQEEER